MRFLVLPCADLLCPQLKLTRFHWTCLFCRLRRRWLGEWTMPKTMISWVLPWSVQPDGSWQSIEIDPRGNAHLKFFRCCAVICFISLANKFCGRTKTLQPRVQRAVRSMTVAKLMNASELLANLTW